MGRRILITGGAGFIGSNLVEYLHRKYPDYHLVILDTLTYAGDVGNLPVTIRDHEGERITFWYGNVTNGELVMTLVSEADMVIHLAAETHVTRSIYDNFGFFETDVLGTQTVANAVLKHSDTVERFIHISTSEVYGSACSELMDEDHPLRPASPYASAKTGADRLVYSYWNTYGIPSVIVRPFNQYGPRQHLEKAIPRFITACLLGEPLTLHGGGLASRDYVFVLDLCQALDLIMHCDRESVIGEEFNVASGVHRSMLSIAQDIVREMGCDENLITVVGDRPGQVSRHTGDGGKARDVLGWQPQTDWESGLRSTIEWYVQHEAWWRRQLWMRSIPIVNQDGHREFR